MKCTQCGKREAKQDSRCWGCLGDWTEEAVAIMKLESPGPTGDFARAIEWMGSVLAIIRWREGREESSYAKGG